MNDNVWKLPHPIKLWNDTRDIVSKNKKVFIGIAGVASIAAFLLLRPRRDDTPLFEQTLVQMNKVEEQAVQQMSRLQYVQNMDQAAGILADSTLPEWQSFQKQVATTKNYKLDKELNQKRELLSEYADLRVQQAKLLYKAFKENSNKYDEELTLVYERINGILDRLQN
ncbi:hypothetical protein [Aridibaculum aurantiacum]|uniref:hypothetical protein n=1 Tax=Aridibaculum aurantiacum TaxID=2810307 RepID=UPI001A9747A9|nr:hypothetical protein [Aridibaculum aurantiacum]